MYSVYRDYTFTIGQYRFGFTDANHDFEGDVTLLDAGPLGGFYRVPFSAATAWMLTVLLLVALLAAAIGLIFRRRRRCDAPPSR